MHSDGEGHDTPWNESPPPDAGLLLPFSPDHVVPPSIVDKTKLSLVVQLGSGLQLLVGGASPTATQVVVDGQEIA